MIKNIWKSIKVFCPRHDELLPLQIESGSKVLFYGCPKYRPENREKGEIACRNFIYLNEYEKMVNHISKLLIDAEKNGEQINLTNHKWSENGIDFEIISHDKEIKITMTNRKALK